MKKNNIGIKGFAMSELLAASIVILLLFSILFANYLPLVAEFENRRLYNNVTANYGLFYVRKIYRSALEDTSVKQTLNQALNTKSFYTVYKPSVQDDPLLITDENDKDQLAYIIKSYNIEEIIITKYKLEDLKGKSSSSNPLAKYKKSDGLLYGYISYLPIYKKSAYSEDQVSEPYRMIIKTKEFGYATSQIIPDPPTPISCFTLNEFKPGEFTILDYDDDKCGENVIVTADEITYNNKKGIITSVTGSESKGAFEGKDLKSITLSKKVTNIGDRAFTNNNISNFSFEKNAPSVTSIGQYALSDNNLSKVIIPSSVSTIKKGAFANNYSLKTIEFDYDTDNTIQIPESMFEMSDVSKLKNNTIDLFIPYNVTIVGKSAFKNIQFSSIVFENNNDEESKPSQLKEIRDSAFETQFANDDKYIQLSIPDSVKKIGSNAFKNVQIGSLTFEEGSNGSTSLQNIGNSAFEVQEVNMDKIDKDKFCINDDDSTPCEEYIRSVKVPATVTTIGSSAFKNQLLSIIAFDEMNASGDIEEYSRLTKIGDYALAGNALETITIPESLGSPDAIVGNKVFGDIGSYATGNNVGEIVLRKDLLSDTKWCNLLYGSNCTETPAEYIEDPEEVSDDETIYTYKYNNITKYISYIESYKEVGEE